MSLTSHRQHILDYLLAGNKITPVQALNNGWGFRLSERIREIEAQGYEIDRAWYTTEGGAEVMQYWLKENIKYCKCGRQMEMQLVCENCGNREAI